MLKLPSSVIGGKKVEALSGLRVERLGSTPGRILTLQRSSSNPSLQPINLISTFLSTIQQINRRFAPINRGEAAPL